MGTYSKERLVKLLNLTASDNDHEALLALRNAQKMMAQGAVTWESLVTARASTPSRRQPPAQPPKARPAKTARPPPKTVIKTPPEPKAKTAFKKFRWIRGLFEFIFAQELGTKQSDFFESLLAVWVSRGSLSVNQQAALERTCIGKGFRPTAA